MTPVVLRDTKAGVRYAGQLQPGTGSHGHPIQVLVLTSERGSPPRRVEPGEASGRLVLLDVTLDEISRLDRAGYHLQAVPRRAGRKGKA